MSGGPPTIEIERQSTDALRALPADGYPLIAILVRPSTLADIDPEAAATVPAGALAADDAAWYVRGLHRTGEAALIDWLVLDAAADRVLASGSVPLGFAGGPGSP